MRDLDLPHAVISKQKNENINWIISKNVCLILILSLINPNNIAINKTMSGIMYVLSLFAILMII